MNDDKLKEIERQLIADIDNDVRIEKEIVESADEIASHLMISKKCDAEINGKHYKLSYRLLEKGTKKIMYVLIADLIKYQIAGNKYLPFSASAEMDQRYSEHDNIKTVIESFIRHVTDRVKPDTLEE